MPYRDKICDHCGATFTPVNSRQKRCSKVCQTDKSRLLNRNHEREKYRSSPERRARQRDYHREYKKRPDVQQRISENQRKYRNNPEVKVRRREQRRERQRRPDVKQQRREYNLRPDVQQHMREYYRERYRRMGGKGYQRNFELLLKRDGPICGICKGLLEVNDDIHVDHIRPVAKGGKNDLDNLQLAHAHCNKSKQDKWDEDAETLSDTQLTLFPYH